MLQGITEEVKKQADQRIHSRIIMYVPGVDDLVVKNAQRGRRSGTSAKSHKLKRARDCLNSPRKNTTAERSWSATSRTSNIKCACTNKDTRSPDMEGFDRTASEKRNYVAALEEGAHCRDQKSHNQARRRQQHREDRRPPRIHTNCAVEKDGFDGLLGGILGRRNHRDNHHNLPKLVSQHTS